MKENRDILIVLTLIFSVLTFSSFSFTQEKKEVKIEKSEQKENKKEEIKSIEFEALVSVSSFFVPVQFAEVFIQTFTIKTKDWVEHYFEYKSQEFYRIFFTHIISKNAP